MKSTNHHSPTPVFRQIYERIRSAILRGDMQPGTRVPSWNDLASELKVSRGTVKAAYDCLAGEGFLISRGAAGTFVNDALTEAKKESKPNTRRAKSLRSPPQDEFQALFGLTSRHNGLQPFQMGVPAFDEFPRTLWSRLVARHARVLNLETMNYPLAAGNPQLRAAIASYLAVARGVACNADQVFITAGYKGALDVITRGLLQAGDAAAVEDPGYPPVRVAMELSGARVIPISVNEEGIDVDALSKASKAKLVIVTPSHHAPLGMPLSLPLRLALLEWAARHRSWIVEDDYYGEFRLQGRPLPALASLNQERVLYVGTFSKALLPSLRLGYIVVPRSLQPLFSRITYYLAPSPAPLLQAAVSDFMQQGHFARHIRRMTSIYSERRAALTKAIYTHFGSDVQLRSSALHVVLPLPARAEDVRVAAAAAEVGLAPGPFTPWFVNAKRESGLLLNFANVPKKDANRYVKALADVVRNSKARKR
jgi:GntR family transcriptional regulator/MocR family aminotransferase